MVKIGRILDSLNFGSANGPLVRGRRSAVHEICSPEAQICRKGKCGKSAYGPQTVRGSSVQPVSFGYTGGVFNEKSADGPPWVRGRSAVVEKNLLEAVPSGVCQIFQSRTVRLGIADSPHLHRNVGPATHGLICSSPFLLPPNRARTWGRHQGQRFLVWFPDDPSTSPDSFRDSPSCPLGISLIPLRMFLDFIMKEARVWVL